MTGDDPEPKIRLRHFSRRVVKFLNWEKFKHFLRLDIKTDKSAVTVRLEVKMFLFKILVV
jgi:hypothetical protein